MGIFQFTDVDQISWLNQQGEELEMMGDISISWLKIEISDLAYAICIFSKNEMFVFFILKAIHQQLLILFMSPIVVENDSP